MPYHHGHLRRALLDAAASVIAESGVAALSLRDLSRRAGVSHAAPTHHFKDKAGLLTALAAEGYDRLSAALEAADTFLDAGVAYVHFAVTHPAHFAVMFRPDLYHADDPVLVAARERAGARSPPGPASCPATAGRPGWPDGRSRTASPRCGWAVPCRISASRARI